MKQNLFISFVVVAAFLALKMDVGMASAKDSKSAAFVPPASARATYNFNTGWKFNFGDVTGAEKPEFDDAKWESVSLPHTWNDIDTYRAYISHGGGDVGAKRFGIGWYR